MLVDLVLGHGRGRVGRGHGKVVGKTELVRVGSEQVDMAESIEFVVGLAELERIAAVVVVAIQIIGLAHVRDIFVILDMTCS